MWYNGQEIPGPFALYRAEHTFMFQLVSQEPPFNTIVSFELIDFTALINNVAYLNVVDQNITIILALSSISAVHKIFIYLCPAPEEQVHYRHVIFLRCCN